MKVSFLLIFVLLKAANNVSAAEELESLMSAALSKLAKVENEEGGTKQDFFFVPLHFDIEMKFNFRNSLVENNNVAQSNVRIFGKNQAKAKWLSLHASGLDFNTSSIQVKSDGKRLAVKEIDYEYNDFYSRVFIYFETEIETQTELEIYMEYKTDIKKLLSVNMGSNTTELLVNYIQNSYRDFSSNCNYMFPCFGNELKSTFNLTLIREKEYTSLSNGNLVSNSAA
ncbi:unnamed protein product [Orchesella dallaii]|uniref:Aminopeptidase N-like N-terminal domain-containing protein n=1 Tax=Orchesella dallaii TaxID=48710 RepID=A0ABP1S8U2_9HEXA